MNQSVIRLLQRGVVPATLALMLMLFGAMAVAQETPNYEIETVAKGFEYPWGMAFLSNDSRMLVTERTGSLKLVDREDGSVEEITGVPEVDDRDQGGLLDIVLHPNFAAEPWVYLAWAGRDDEGLTTTYIGRGRLDLDALTLTDFEVLLVAEPHTDSVMHYGSRLVFSDDNRLFIAIGDRRDENFGPEHVSQDLSNYHGKTLRLEADGSIPADNPFVNDPDALDAIYSYGHRNVQGMAIHPETGELWQNEHGEYNGDEINLIIAGGNYGWPIVAYGVDYETQERFAPLPPANPETIDPLFFWTEDHPEGFPPSGFAFYTGDAFPDWQGSAFMGNLAHQYIGQFAIEGHEVRMTGRLLEGEGWRIRDVAVGPDNGFLYVLIDDSDVPIVRLRPAGD